MLFLSTFYITKGPDSYQFSDYDTDWAVRESIPSCGWRFSAIVQTGPGAHLNRYRLIPGVKRRSGVDHPPLSKYKVKEKGTAITPVPLWTIVPCSMTFRVKSRNKR